MLLLLGGLTGEAVHSPSQRLPTCEAADADIMAAAAVLRAHAACQRLRMRSLLRCLHRQTEYLHNPMISRAQCGLPTTPHGSLAAAH